MIDARAAGSGVDGTVAECGRPYARVAHDIDCFDPALESREGAREIFGSPDFEYRHIDAE